MLPIPSARIVLFALTVGGASIGRAVAQPVPLGELSLEDLARMEVTTVSRKAQKISDTPAAVTVLSADDIRRSGARSIPEALRLVPGVDVGQIASGRYAVGIRGFNGRFSNALLVQVDGRSVYSPFYSGVFWETINLMLEDVERIEVIRGPGAALWGANAVNGVINIVTRRATATQGALAVASVDDHGKPTGAVRYGTMVPDVAAVRLYAIGAELSPSRDSRGEPAGDTLSGWRAGTRVDSVAWSRGTWMLQGEAWEQKAGETFLLPSLAAQSGAAPTSFEMRHRGAHLLGRAAFGAANGEVSVQGYLDHGEVSMGADGGGKVTTLDVDVQHRFAPIGRHEILAGAAYKFSRTEIDANGAVLTVAPTVRRLHVASAFVQDEITLHPGAWKLTLGGKAEYASISGTEFQPNARILWTPSSQDSAWAGLSRAVRTPSVGESDATLVLGVQPTPPGTIFPAVVAVTRPKPGVAMDAERLTAAELGYRRSLGDGSLEAVAFVHEYRRIIGAALSPNGPVFPGRLRFPFPPFSLPDYYVDRSNVIDGRSTGIELSFDLPLGRNARLHGTYAHLDTTFDHYDDPATAASAGRIASSAPRHTATLRLAATPASGHELDLIARYVGAVQAGAVPAYATIDLRYAWKVTRNFEISLIGQNLADPLHLEFTTDFLPSVPLYQPRRAYLQATLNF